MQAVREGRSPVVLTERNEHLDRLAGRLSSEHPSPDRASRRHAAEGGSAIVARLAAIPENEERVLLATGRYIGEGFDDARLDTLFLTLPVSWRGTIAQYVGRLHRLHDRKREVRVYDYADLNVPMLARMFDRRCRGYEAVGYTILLPASAVPGWPAEVPLPVDPGVEERLCRQRPAADSRRRGCAAGESVRPRGTDGASRCGRHRIVRGVRPRHFCIAGWKRCRKPPDCST